MRAQVVLLRDGMILCARHERASECYWVLPGGEIEVGETPEEAAVRELREEGGVDVELERLLFIDEPRRCHEITIKEPRYTYLGRIVGGAVQSLQDREGGCAEKGFLAGLDWLPFDYAGFDGATRNTLKRVQSSLETQL
jgi:ADP-ribose pyrophosphatase YjhB (NUDIX family)